MEREMVEGRGFSGGGGTSSLDIDRNAVTEDFRGFVQDLAATTFSSPAAANVESVTSATDITRLAIRTLEQRLGSDALPGTAAERAHAKRYIVFAPTAQSSSGPVIRDSLKRIHSQLGPGKIIRSPRETAAKVLGLTCTEAAVLRERFPSLVVAEDVLYEEARVSPLLPEVMRIAVASSGGKTITIELRGPDGEPVADARIILIVDRIMNSGFDETTDEHGTWRGTVHSGFAKFARMIVVPKRGYWSRCASNVNVESMRIVLQRVPSDGWDWGHLDLHARDRGPFDGASVTVAVIDSGIGPHPSLNVIGGMNYLDGEPESAWQDSQQHGTHCAGIIAAAGNPKSTWGWAPGVRLLSLRVLDQKGFGLESNIAFAVEWAVEQGCDIISLSLTGGGSTGFLQQQIDEASNAGVLCVAAAGNAGGDVAYPARFPWVQAVSAIGRHDAYPADSIHADARTEIQSADGKYYFASFSNRGDAIDFCAPGVAVTSTVPAADFAPIDGTSMAAPHVSGLAALALTRNDGLRNRPRDTRRLVELIDVLKDASIDLGMGRKYQGNGLPFVSKL